MKDRREISIEDAHAVLEEHYREPVRPISEVCKGITTWLDAIHDEHLEDSDDYSLHQIALACDGFHGLFLSATANKSNLLYRLLYLRQPLRTKKCPTHDGHWSGYGWPGEGTCECAVGLDLTGWLPND